MMAELLALFNLEDSLAVFLVRRMSVLPDGPTQQVRATGLCGGKQHWRALETRCRPQSQFVASQRGPIYPPALFFPLLKPREAFTALACLSLLTGFGMPSHLNKKKNSSYVSC